MTCFLRVTAAFALLASGCTAGAGGGDQAGTGGQGPGTGGASGVGTGGAAASGTGGNPTTGAAGSSAGPAIAFPGAQGFGKNATGARNSGTVYHVTNLNDSGAGSFRDAVSAANRFVVFDVGGYITLKTAVSVKSNIT